MTLTSEKINVFVETKKTKNGDIKVFSTSVGTKDKEGNYTNKSLEVSFGKDALSKENLEKLTSDYYYQVAIMDAFLTCRRYQNAKGENVSVFLIKVLKCKVLGRKPMTNSKSDDLPFKD